MMVITKKVIVDGQQDHNKTQIQEDQLKIKNYENI